MLVKYQYLYKRIINQYFRSNYLRFYIYKFYNNNYKPKASPITGYLRNGVHFKSNCIYSHTSKHTTKSLNLQPLQTSRNCYELKLIDYSLQLYNYFDDVKGKWRSASLSQLTVMG